jgi:hypothetical protein
MSENTTNEYVDLSYDAAQKHIDILKKIRSIYRENKKNARKIQTNTAIIQVTNDVKTKHIRASVENNGFELLIPLLLLFKNITISNLFETLNIIKTDMYYANIVIFNHSDDFDKYTSDLAKKKTIITDYINNFYFEIENNHSDFKKENIKCIYISGKANKHNKIKELNKNYNKIETKSDIYVELNSGELIGISIKQDTKATKSNYSVHKILGKEEDKRLTNIKNQYLLTNGFSKPFNKCDRENHNKLFYPHIKDNEYWIELKKQISAKTDIIKEMLLKNLYCRDVNYRIYEFNGTHLVKLNDMIPSTNTNVTFEEYNPYYYTKSGNLREAAKLFYKLVINEKKYRVEVRWKGDIRFSPQFQIHDEL